MLPWQALIVAGNVYDEDVDTGSSAKPPLFRPVVDGWVIPLSYSQTYAAGAQNDVPFIAGNNRDESGAVPETAFAHLRSQANSARPGAGSPHPNVTLADFQSAAKQKFGPMFAEFAQLYPASTDEEAALANDAAVRDNSRVSTFLWTTEWHRHARSAVFTYFWTHRPPGPDHDTRGAYHGSEIDYVFDNLDVTNKPWTAEDRRIAGIMSSFWANFAATGNPNGKGLPEWPAVDAKSPVVMELGDHFGPIPVADGARFEFWKKFFLTQAAW